MGFILNCGRDIHPRILDSYFSFSFFLHFIFSCGFYFFIIFLFRFHHREICGFPTWSAHWIDRFVDFNLFSKIVRPSLTAFDSMLIRIGYSFEILYDFFPPSPLLLRSSVLVINCAEETLGKSVRGIYRVWIGLLGCPNGDGKLNKMAWNQNATWVS